MPKYRLQYKFTPVHGDPRRGETNTIEANTPELAWERYLNRVAMIGVSAPKQFEYLGFILIGGNKFGDPRPTDMNKTDFHLGQRVIVNIGRPGESIWMKAIITRIHHYSVWFEMENGQRMSRGYMLVKPDPDKPAGQPFQKSVN